MSNTVSNVNLLLLGYSQSLTIAFTLLLKTGMATMHPSIHIQWLKLYFCIPYHRKSIFPMVYIYCYFGGLSEYIEVILLLFIKLNNDIKVQIFSFNLQVFTSKSSIL